MGVAKQMIVLLELVAWGMFVGAAIFFSPLSVGLEGGGMFPQPAVSGVGGVPVMEIGIATGLLIVAMIITGRVVP